MKSKVTILMSTYNGERFLNEQIDSILQQEDIETCLFVRDDGSEDKTISMLKQYQKAHVLRFYQGHNLGPAMSFMNLLMEAPATDYYAFSDQDDFWEKDKLSVAIDSLRKYPDEPALYFGRTQLADKKLNILPSPELAPKLTFGESLIHEFIPGCTMVLNNKLREIVNTYQPDYIPMHDVWIYSIAQAIGARIIFDPHPHILYRQHADNTIGQGYSIWHEWKRRWKRISSDEQSRSRRANELIRGYSKYIDKERLSLLHSFVDGKQSLLQRLRLLGDKRLRCTNRTTQILFWINILINKY